MPSTSSAVGVAARLASISRVVQFVAVGAVGALCDMATLAVVHGVLSVPVWLAKLPAAEASIVVMFALNERYTFSGEGRPSPLALGRRFLTSNAVRVGGLIVGWAVLVAVYRAGTWYLFANAVGLCAGVVVNYLAESLLTWRIHV